MKLSIEKVYDKGSGKFNEDEILIKKNLFAVFDGAGSLTNFLSKEGKTGGKIAAEIAKNTFSRDNQSLKNLAIKTNNLIREGMEDYNFNFLKKETLWCTTAAVVRIKKDDAEFLQIGDSLILTILKSGKPKLVTTYYDQDLETMIKWKKLCGRKQKNIWSLLKREIIGIRRKQNLDYGVLNGEKKAINFLKSGRFNLKNITDIIVFTDGLLIPKKSPKEGEDWNKFAKLYKELSLKGLFNYVRSIEETDPDCSLYPRFKEHDDIAAIAIKIK